MTTLYLPVVTGKDIRDAVKATIATWADTYTLEVGRQKGVTLQPLRTYGVDITILPDGTVADELPACRITAPGVLGEPSMEGSGTYTADWAVGVGVVVAGRTGDEATNLADLYVAAMRALILQHGSLGGIATSTAWLDEEITPIAYERDRVVAAGSLMFSARIPGLVSRSGGPVHPVVDPTVPLDAGTVSATSIDVSRTS